MMTKVICLCLMSALNWLQLTIRLIGIVNCIFLAVKEKQRYLQKKIKKLALGTNEIYNGFHK